VHPTFLYESLWNLAVLIVLVIITLKHLKRFHGEIFLGYLMLYGIGRFWIEGLRTDQLRFWGTQIAVSQVLAAILAVGSAVLILLIRSRNSSQNP
jgi:phosphatidylglycerol:prolipoprotein diacylglycerol transferase